MGKNLVENQAQKAEVNVLWSYWRLITNRVPERPNQGTVLLKILNNGLEKAVECALINFGDSIKLRRLVHGLDSRAVQMG